MAWAGIGVVWTVSGGVPRSRLIGAAKADEAGFSFVQISDSHIGFEKPANPDARATLKEAVDKIAGMPRKPAFLIHTGDITHSAKPQQFDDAEQILGDLKLDIHYSPGRARHYRSRDPEDLPANVTAPARPGRLVFVRPGRRSFHFARQCR